MAQTPSNKAPRPKARTEKQDAAADYLQVAPETKAMNDLAAQIIALADNRDSATRTDYAHPRFKEIVAILKDLQSR